MASQYQVILTLRAPFCEPVDQPYGPPQPDRLKAAAILIAAFELRGSDDDEWSGLQSIRIDVTDVEVL